MKVQPPPLTACLLAGGKSSRMGRDKAGVEFLGTPLWQHQLHTLQKTGANEILISGRKDACYGGSGVTVIEDEIKNTGPLAGIATMLEAATNPLVLMLAVDMPYMTDAFLLSLREQSSVTRGAVPELDGFFEGVAAIFPKSAGVIATRILQGNDHSIQHFVRECVANEQVKIVTVSNDETALFKSLNAPSDLLETQKD
ncbi:MAG: molybdenum cofactor guanylyltransferase [Verrucomicrobiota bacterium]